MHRLIKLTLPSSRYHTTSVSHRTDLFFLNPRSSFLSPFQILFSFFLSYQFFFLPNPLKSYSSRSCIFKFSSSRSCIVALLLIPLPLDSSTSFYSLASPLKSTSFRSFILPLLLDPLLFNSWYSFFFLANPLKSTSFRSYILLLWPKPLYLLFSFSFSFLLLSFILPFLLIC